MKTNQAMGTLKHIWDVESVDIHTEYLIYGYSSESGFFTGNTRNFQHGMYKKISENYVVRRNRPKDNEQIY